MAPAQEQLASPLFSKIIGDGDRWWWRRSRDITLLLFEAFWPHFSCVFLTEAEALDKAQEELDRSST